MTAVGQDTLGTRSTLQVGERQLSYYSLAKAAESLGDISRLPFSMKVLLENLLRFEDGKTVTTDDLKPNTQQMKDFIGGLPVILSGLKTLLETGQPLFTAAPA